MSKYTLNFKMDDINLEIVTSDRDFIDNEMQKWVFAVSKKEVVEPVNALKDVYQDAKSSFKPQEPQKVVENIKSESEMIQKSTVDETSNENKFTNVLKEKIETESIALKVKEKMELDISIKEYTKDKELLDPKDFLVAAAFYLSEKEKVERFSLKQINSKVLTLTSRPIDHSVMQESVNEELIKIIPDFTGMADVTEYALTLKGEEYYLNEL